MKYADLMNDKDRADLAQSGQLVDDGKALRRRVFARLRARAFRGTKPARETLGENATKSGDESTRYEPAKF